MKAPYKLYVWDLWRAEVFTVAIMTPANWPGPLNAIASLNPQFSPDGMNLWDKNLFSETLYRLETGAAAWPDVVIFDWQC
jgi:hypothetical protein